MNRIALALLWVPAVFAIGCSEAHPTHPLNGRPAPDFTLTDLSGRSVALSALRGKPVLLAFWAPGCPPCRAEAPHLTALDNKYKDQGLVVLAAHAWSKRETEATVRDYVAENKLGHTILLNGADVAYEQYQVVGIPTVFWIDRNGKIVGYHLGFEPEDVDGLDAMARKMLEP
jgi:thiol-disulfide isomerase/thioredoxin